MAFHSLAYNLNFKNVNPDLTWKTYCVNYKLKFLHFVDFLFVIRIRKYQLLNQI